MNEPTKLTPEELHAIRERADAATPGPWQRSTKGIFGPELARGWQQLVAEADDFGDAWHNGEFIAHARTDIPAMLAHIAALEAENARMRAIVAAVAKWAYGLDHDASGAFVRGSMYSMSCPICHRRLTGPEYSERDDGHTPDCPVTKARALLASDGNDTTPPEGE